MKEQHEETKEQFTNVINKLTLVGSGIDEIIIDEPGLKGAKTIIMECVKDLKDVFTVLFENQK